MERAGEPEAAVGPRDAAVALAAAALVGGLAAADGGYFPVSWGWAGLAALWAVSALLVLGRTAITRRGLAMLALLTAFCGWTLVSALWTESVPLTALEAERSLTYVAILGAALLAARPRALLAGTLAGAAAACAANLLARAPGVMGGVAEPVGYENGLAFLAALGIVLALGLAPWGLLALPLLVPVLVTMESRGAWLALVVGALATFLPRARVPLVAAGLAVAVATGMTVGSERPGYWPVAFAQWTGAPLGGTGAGTFSRVWLEERESLQVARDAHNLYLETLGELGLVGFLLLAAALAVPLVPHAAQPVAAGAVAAYAVHAAVDWDWEQAALTAGILLCAAAALAREDAIPLGTRARRASLIATGVLAVVVLVTLLGNVATARSRDAAAASDWDGSARWARTARRLAPWAAEPWHRLAEAQRARGDAAAARRSLREALDRDPGDADLWVALARVAEGAERERALERAARLNPRGAARVENAR